MAKLQEMNTVIQINEVSRLDERKIRARQAVSQKMSQKRPMSRVEPDARLTTQTNECQGMTQDKTRPNQSG